MKKINTIYKLGLSMLLLLMTVGMTFASSHREAPLISDDPLADNVDVYAFRSPDNPDMITIIATYVPLQLPHGGPNYYTFGENIRYEIHVDNDTNTPGDDVTYRFTFDIVNEDPTTFFNIRLGAQNQKATYTLERSTDGGETFTTIVTDGYVPPTNVGTRSIEGGAGLNTTYDALFNEGITTASSGETVFAGPTDDPFFVDLGGIFDLGDAPRQNGTPVDGVACYNVSALALQVPISTLLKDGAPAQPTNILDSDYVIGVWASASRPAITTLSSDSDPEVSGDWKQVSRLGMPLTNEAVIAIGDKDYWNALSPYDEITETTLDAYFYNPELALYMDDDQFGAAVPAFASLRIQEASLGMFDFTNGADGLFPLKGSDAVAGTALDDDIFGTLLLPGPGQPRSVDLWPIFHTGAPNLAPYQLATGKMGNPLADGKPFINNFLPNGGDMLRLNMAVPATPRDDTNFSSLGLVQAAAIGLTVAPFNTTADLEFIPNMDGFPNGRRLEDDVTRIELQAVAGVVLAAVGLWYDDYDPETSASPVTQDLLDVLGYTTGVESNDRPFTGSFPYLAQPFSGTGDCSGEIYEPIVNNNNNLGDAAYKVFLSSNTQANIATYAIAEDGSVSETSFGVDHVDSDGIAYDKANDVLYQLDRTNNVVKAYSGVAASLDSGSAPTLTATSTSDFVNGRGMSFSNGKLVIAEDANDANGNQNRFVIYNASANSITLDKTYDSPLNLWDVHLEGDFLKAIQDNSNNITVYMNFFDNAPGSSVSPDVTFPVEGLVRTHGLSYDAQNDILVLTDIGEASSADDGALVYIANFEDAKEDGVISDDEQIRIAGPLSNLGNPVDVAYDGDQGIIYVAERANGGGRYLAFDVPSTSGDASPVANQTFAGASSIDLVDCLNANVNFADAAYKVFMSSNNQASVGAYAITENGIVAQSSFDIDNVDSDGIAYDKANDVLYQLDRTNNVVKAYSGVAASLDSGSAPTLTATSTSDFVNGRGMSFSDGKLVVAVDANDANGNQNSFVIYDASATSITLDRIYDSPLNLWDVHLEGDFLKSIEDNSNNITVYMNFFDNAPGSSVLPDVTFPVESLVRTHGLAYDSQYDILVLTDVGEASSPDDGAIIYIANFEDAKEDGVISDDEQIRIAGPLSNLGNPVDVAYDGDQGIIYVAERANGGGRYLAFDVPSTSGDYAPLANQLYAGASSVDLADCLNVDVNDGDPVSLVYFDLDACSAFAGTTTFNYDEFTPEYPNTLSCGSVVVDGTLNRANPSVNTHSCTPGAEGSAMCVSSDDSCTYNPASDKRIVIDFTVSPGDNPIAISSLNFFEKGPEMYDWISGASGPNNYPTLYGVRIMANGSPIFTQSDIPTTTEWTEETFDFSDNADFTFSEETNLSIYLIGYCPVGNGAPVSAWDIDEVSINGNCVGTANKGIAGIVSTPNGSVLEGIQVALANDILPEYPRTSTTDDQGAYAFTNLPIGYDYEVSGIKNDDYTNGVSTLDLIILQDYILGFSSFDSAFEMIAADVNNNKKVSASDVVELRKLILNVIPAIDGNGSWKFVDGAQNLNMVNPWNYRETLSISGLNTDMNNENFVAIKVGDLSGNAQINATAAESEIRNGNTIYLEMTEQTFKKGDQIRVPVSSADFDALRGMQYTLQHDGLTLQYIESGSIDIVDANYAQINDNLVTVSWSNVSSMSFGENEVLFTLNMIANRDGSLSDFMSIGDEVIAAEAYSSDLSVNTLALDIRDNGGIISQTQLYDNVPNPFSTSTNISFYLGQDGPASVTLYDITGKVIKTYNDTYTAGKQMITVRGSDIANQSGVIYYTLESNGFTATKQMIIMK